MNIGKNIVIIGMQWGDEGKGKIIDFLAKNAHGVVRFQGGHNSGHTIINNKKKIVLRIIPSGIMHSHISCYIGNGVVLSPEIMFNEINFLEKNNINVSERLFISNAATLIFPYHIAIDNARENINNNQFNKIGTTCCGIGPAYEDKVARRGIRVQDIFNPKIFSKKLKESLDFHNFVLTRYLKSSSIDFNQAFDSVFKFSEKIIPMILDIPSRIYKENSLGHNFLFEGAQGSLLDIDHGTYPFVTSSNCVAGSASIGSGISPKGINYILGVTKAYCTRVGHGPFPSELYNIDNPLYQNKLGLIISKTGKEFGSVTGRPRRIGWLDIVTLRKAIQINGICGLCITKIDILDFLDEIKICIGYKINGKEVINFPINIEEVILSKPIYKTFNGWKTNTCGITKWDELPINAQIYLSYIEKISGVPIDMISTGSGRNEIIILNNIFNI